MTMINLRELSLCYYQLKANRPIRNLDVIPDLGCSKLRFVLENTGNWLFVYNKQLFIYNNCNSICLLKINMEIREFR